jgi:hypothetical protein
MRIPGVGERVTVRIRHDRLMQAVVTKVSLPAWVEVRFRRKDGKHTLAWKTYPDDFVLG